MSKYKPKAKDPASLGPLEGLKNYWPTVDEVYDIIRTEHPHIGESVVDAPSANLGPADAIRKKLERQFIVSRLRIRGVRNQTYIAEALGVSTETINRDFRDTDALFKASTVANVQVEKGLDLARIEVAIQALMPSVEAASLPAIREVTSLLARKAKLLGLDAPAEVNLINWRSELEKRGVDAGSVYDQVVSTVATMLARPAQRITTTIDQEEDDEDGE